MKVLSQQELKEKLTKKKVGQAEEEKQSTDSSPPSSIDKESPEKDLKNYLLSLLTRREYSNYELRQKAALRNADKHLLEKIMDELIEDNYQSDLRYAEMVLRSRISRLSGPVKIRMELKQKGVSEALIEQVLRDADCDWFELAADSARKKYKPVDEKAAFVEKQKARAKLMRFLHGRGFDSEQIRYAVECVEKG